MGTRGIFGFHADGQDKLSYNHYDSYPDYLGKEVLQFIQGSTMESLTKIAKSIILINSDIPPTKEQIKECAPWTDLGVSSGSTSDWYCLLRNAQGDMNAYKNGLKYMSDSNSFALDSLFCEYGYIINTDTKKLEFYSGFNQMSRTNKGRYADKSSGGSSEYYGIALVAKFDLSKIIEADDEMISLMVEQMNKKKESFRKKQEKELKPSSSIKI